MTEASLEDSYLVKVKAQVMARDEATGGWLPLSGGGLANVSIRKRSKLSTEVKGFEEYIIFGQRISDQTVILSCVINKELQYFKVMPTFHHWKSGAQRNGLTFQTAADARAFDKAVISAYDALLDDISKNSEPTADEEVFMDVNLPMDRSQSRSTSEGSGSHQSIDQKILKAPSKDPLPKIQTPPLYSENNSDSLKSDKSLKLKPIDPIPLICDNYSYVQLTPAPVQDFITSSGAMAPSTFSIGCRDSPQHFKKPPPSLNFQTNLRCKYCSQFYSQDSNRRGSCSYAPDCVKTGIETISGLKCAKCMVYHCLNDPEDDGDQKPCSCTGDSCTKRWIGLTLLSFIVPCLCFYPFLRGCHYVCVRCGLCGGKHSVAQ